MVARTAVRRCPPGQVATIRIATPASAMITRTVGPSTKSSCRQGSPTAIPTATRPTPATAVATVNHTRIEVRT